jgi:hypothetical protein
MHSIPSFANKMFSNQNSLAHSKGTVKFTMYLINPAVRQEDFWESGGITPPILITSLGDGEWSASRLGRRSILLVAIG